VTVIARDIEDFERIHTSQLSRLPRVSRIQSSFAIRNVVDRSFPPAALLPPGKAR
jgi:Lrp/AsnC family leucine-responsive transcriptional regulator